MECGKGNDSAHFSETQNRQTERKAFRFELDDSDESGVFSGHAAVFGNCDSGNDIIEKGAFTNTLAQDFDRIKILALHNDFWLPVGKPIELREDENGLFIKGKISDTTMGKDIKTLMKDGVLNELSIGYNIVNSYFDREGVRHLKAVRLWEVSIVTWAMNDRAKIDVVKSMAVAENRQTKSTGTIFEIITKINRR